MAVYGINYFVIMPMLFDMLSGSLPIPTALSLDQLCQVFRLDQLDQNRPVFGFVDADEGLGSDIYRLRQGAYEAEGSPGLVPQG